MDEKILALSLYSAMGGQGYNFCRHMFPLPSVSILTEMLTKVPLEAGLSDFMKQHLKSSASVLSDKEKVCILMWDECALQPRLDYKESSEIIIGHEDWGTNRTENTADHMLVFMLRGIKSGWLIPISYSFCDKVTSGAQLVRCIKHHVEAVVQAGFTIIATVCDQAAPNVAAVKQLLSQSRETRIKNGLPERDTILIGENEFVHLYDAPHLLKGIRNNLLNKHLQFKRKNSEITEFAKWQVVETAYFMDKHRIEGKREMPKLTDQHVKKNLISKMRVKYVAEVASSTVSSFISSMSDKAEPQETLIGPLAIDYVDGKSTSFVLQFFNDLFDSFNSENTEEENELRNAVTENSKHHDLWGKAVELLKSMKFVNMKTLKPDVDRVKSINNWIITINGVQKLWRKVRDLGFVCFNTKFLNQDPLESFFSEIRAHRVTNTKPTPFQAQQSFKTLLINNMTGPKRIGANCNMEEGKKILFSLHQFLDNVSGEDNTENLSETDAEFISLRSESEDFPSQTLQCEINSADFSRKVLRSVNFCEDCAENLQGSQYKDSINSYSLNVLNCLNERSHFRDLESVLKKETECNAHFNWNVCLEHTENIKKLLIKLIIKKCVFIWCARKNSEIVKQKKNQSIEEDRQYLAEISNNIQKRQILLPNKKSSKRKV